MATKKGTAATKKSGVFVRLADGEGRAERLRAAHAGGDLYRLEEGPSFAYSVSVGDTVRAKARRRGGALVFQSVAEKSGNRTLRLLFSRFGVESPQAEPIIAELRGMGCACDHAEEFILRLTLPPEVSLEVVVDFLKSLAMWWEHADPTYAELYGDED